MLLAASRSNPGAVLRDASTRWTRMPSALKVKQESAAKGATGTDAACLDPYDDECLWASHVIVQKRSQWEGCGDGAKPMLRERAFAVLTGEPNKLITPIHDRMTTFLMPPDYEEYLAPAERPPVHPCASFQRTR
jgi:hypothetical protein